MAEQDIKSLTQANAALAESYDDLSDSLLRQLNTSKAWNFMSRMTSGSGFWKVQNKLRAVTDAYVYMDDAMKESIKTQSKAAATMEKLRKVQEKMPQRDTSGDFNPEDLMELPEYKQQIETYTKAFDGDEDEASKTLLKNITSQLEANENMLGGLEAQMIEAIKYEQMGPGAKFRFKMGKLASLAKNVFKMLLRFLISASIGFIMLILVLPLAIKAFKLISKHISMKDIKKVLGVVKKVIMFIFDVLKAAFSGNYGELFGLVYDKVISPLISWLGEKIGNILTKISEAGKDLKDKIVLAFMSSAPVQLFLRLADMLMNSPLVKGATGAVKGVKSFLGLSTGGTINRGGMAIVGENGPELVSLPSGATVHSNSQSKGMGNTIHVHVNGRVGASDAEIRDIAQKVAREINLQMNRTTSAVGRF